MSESFGWLFEHTNKARAHAQKVRLGTTESFERELAQGVYELSEVIEDLLIIVRDHLSCHDCPDPEEDDDEEVIAQTNRPK